MPRVFIPAERIKDEGILLRPKETRYISKVLRLDPGDEVRVFDGEGWGFDSLQTSGCVIFWVYDRSRREEYINIVLGSVV